MQLILSIPDKRLNPNTCIGWKAKLSAKHKARISGEYTAYNLSHDFQVCDRLYMYIIVHYKDKRKRDLDNTLSNMKYTLDGIFKSLKIDDSQIDKIILERGEVLKNNPHIKITISRIGENNAYKSS